MKKRKKPTPQTPQSIPQHKKELLKTYAPTPEERAAEEAVRSRRKTPRVKVSRKKGMVSLSLDCPEESYEKFLLMEALGTVEPDFAAEFLPQLAKAATRGQKVDEVVLNFSLAVIKGVEPKDQIEAMLAAQMAAVHSLTMTFARRLNNIDNIPQQDSAERAFNKLARTFAAQVEALKRYRSNGEQKVVVEHISVSEGGKAIVGNVLTHGGAGSSEKLEPSS